MVAFAYIQDMTSDERMTLLGERAHGCTSNVNGMLEVMLHRHVLYVDANEKEPVRFSLL